MWPARAFPFLDNAHPRIAVSSLLQDQKSLALFTRVYEAWNKLDDGHPWSRKSQCALHSSMCGHGGSGPDIHKSWGFLPWHRCFVHFHERVLIANAAQKSVPGAADFRLPYWDWDKNHEIPGFYSKPGSPVYMDRDTPNIAYYTTPDFLSAMLSPGAFQGHDGFGGAADAEGIVRIYSANKYIYTIVSDVMRDPATAAGDPLFFIHHANVDRMWEIWSRQNQPLPPYPDDLLNRVFEFPNEPPQKPFQYSVRDIMETESLGYSYDSYDCGVHFSGKPETLDTEPVEQEFVSVNQAATDKLAPAAQSLTPHRVLVYVTVSGIALPWRREGYSLFLKPRLSVPPVGLGNVTPFQSPHAQSQTISATAAIHPRELLGLSAGFRVVYTDGDAPLSQAAEAAPAYRLSLRIRTLRGA